MKVKKYPQSHLLIEKDGSKIMIDPGNITFTHGYKVEEFQGCVGYLITHQHADHLDGENIKAIVQNHKVFGNEDVVNKLKEFGVEAQVVRDREVFYIGEFEITPIDLPHCPPSPDMEGVVMPPNTGFLINGVLFHPGDGYEAPQQLFVDNVALPIIGPTITTESALKFAQDIKARLVIPIHYNSRFKADPAVFALEAEKQGIEVMILDFGEETEI